MTDKFSPAAVEFLKQLKTYGPHLRTATMSSVIRCDDCGGLFTPAEAVKFERYCDDCRDMHDVVGCPHCMDNGVGMGFMFCGEIVVP